MVAHVELARTAVRIHDQPMVTPQNNQNPLPEIIPPLSSSEGIMCIEIQMETPATPENTRHENIDDTSTKIKTAPDIF